MPAIRHDLETLRRSALRWMAIRGIGAGLAVVVLVAITLGLIDYLIRWQSLSGRFGQTVVWLAATGYACWRFLYRPWKSPPSESDLARAIHRRWTQETPDLISAAEFETAGVSESVGAPRLQQVTISRAQLQLATIPWRQVIDLRPAGLACGAALAGVLIAGLLTWLRPELISIGMQRLLSPTSALSWPRETTLVYLNADLERIDTARDPALRASQGDPLTVYIENLDGPLPSLVNYERRSPQGTRERGELRQTTLRDPQGRSHSVAVATLPTTERFSFRAEGGDDDRAPWVEVDVVPPLRVEEFTITVTPPPYSGQPAETLQSGVGHLQGLVGSQVQIRCRSTAALKSVQVIRGNEPRQSVALDATKRQFEWNWTITSAERTTYWLDLVDPFDLRAANPSRYEIRGVADQEPVVTLAVPATDLRVTPEAEIEISGEARDDLGLARVELAYEIPNFADPAAGTVTQTIPLGPPPPAPDQPAVTVQAVKTTWNLAELKLNPGAQVRFWLQATDHYNLNGAKGQTGRSATRILSILSEPDKRQELAARQTQLADQIAQLRDKQESLTETTRELAKQWNAVGELRPSEQVDLDRVQTDQRDLAQNLAATPRGVLTELRALQKELSQNRITAPEISDALARWEAGLDPLTEQILPQVDQKLDAARQAATPKPGAKTPPKEQTAANLEQALAGQQQTLDELGLLSNELAQWQRDKDLESKFAELAGKQASLREQSLSVGKQTAGKPVPDLSSQEQADLARAADRQSNLARDVEQLASQLAAAAQKSENGPQQNEAFGEIAKRLDEQSVAAAMREISDELRQNHVQSATDAQQKLLDSLDEMRKEMDRSKSLAAQSQVDELRKQVEDIQYLENRQQEMIKRTEALASPTADTNREAELEELKKLEKEIAQQTSQLAQKLRKEQRRSASQAAQRANQQMNEATETLENEQIAESLERQREALDELQQTQESLQQELASAEQQAQQQALATAGLLVASLLERAKSTRDETIRLEELRVSSGKWSRSQLKSVQQTAEAQREIAESVREAGKDLGSEGVLNLCLELANEHFGTAATRLGDRDAGLGTQSQQLAGESLLEQFLASLETPDPTSQPPSQQSGDSPQGPADGEGEQGQPSSPLLAVEVRLLLGMQQGLLARTKDLNSLKAQGHDLTSDQVAEVKLLRDRQKRLVETARKMVREEALEALP